MEINLKNIEELIFFNKEVQQLLPEFRHFFDSWHLGKRFPELAGLGNKMVFDLLSSLKKEHLEKLESYFNDKILVSKLENNIVGNYSSELEFANELCEYTEYKEFCAYRSKDKLFLSFWR
jgi:hypothetical protein